MLLCVIVVFEAFWKNGMLKLVERRWYICRELIVKTCLVSLLCMTATASQDDDICWYVIRVTRSKENLLPCTLIS